MSAFDFVARQLTRVFGAPEEINGAERCPTYLYRWTIWKGRNGRAAYIHRFVGDDWSRDLHDHPKQFTSIGLWGSYVEILPRQMITKDLALDTEEKYSAPWIRRFPATHIHRLKLNSRECWTLVIVGPAEREWGFWKDGQWIRWREYVIRGGAADGREACK